MAVETACFQRIGGAQVSTYLILHRDRSQGMAIWWRANRSGYTADVAEAGHYTKEEAEAIATIRGDDFPVPWQDLGTVLKIRRVVNVEDGENFKLLKLYESRAQTVEAKP